VFGIHREPMKRATTIRNLNSQHPSWNNAATLFLAKRTKNTIKWNTAKTNDILTIAEVPKQAKSVITSLVVFVYPPIIDPIISS
jgi:hypothetical protein